MYSWIGAASTPFLQWAELLFKAGLIHRKVRRGQWHIHEAKVAILNIFKRLGGPVLIDRWVTLKREAFFECCALGRIMNKERTDARFNSKLGPAVGRIIGDAVLTLARGVYIKQGRRFVVLQIGHHALEEVVRHGCRTLHHEDIRVERSDQTQFLAIFLLAFHGRAEAGQVAILTGQRRSGGLTARIGIDA